MPRAPRRGAGDRGRRRLDGALRARRHRLGRAGGVAGGAARAARSSPTSTSRCSHEDRILPGLDELFAAVGDDLPERARDRHRPEPERRHRAEARGRRPRPAARCTSSSCRPGLRRFTSVVPGTVPWTWLEETRPKARSGRRRTSGAAAATSRASRPPRAQAPLATGFSMMAQAMLPIDRPGKIICVGLNYSDHAEEQGVDLPDGAAPLREVAEHADRPRRSDRHPAGRDEVRLRGRARRRDRLDASATSRPRTRSRRSPATSASTTSPRATCSSPTASGRAASRLTRSARSGRARAARRGARPAGARRSARS